MKIAVIRQRYVSHGGAENVVARFVAILLQRGHEVHVFASRWKVPQGEAPPIFHRVPTLGWGSFFRLITFAFFCRIGLQRERFDVIYGFERTLVQDIYRAGDGCHREWLEQRKKSSSPLKRLGILLNPFHWTSLWIERRIYAGSRTKKIIANSLRGKEEIIRHYGTSPEKIVVIYNGVSLSRFNPSNRERFREEIRRRFGAPEKELLILFVGSGFERKGLRFLIEALGLLRLRNAPPFKLWVVGKGKIDRYLRIARRAGIEDSVSFIGTYAKMEEIYAAADVFALPTLYDPFANVCLEAMASGVPVVTTRINGASEVLAGPLESLVLESPDDVKGLADILLKMTDPDQRAELGLRARQAAERFPDEAQFEEILSLHQKL